MRCHERDCAYSPSAHSSSPFALSFPVVAVKVRWGRTMEMAMSVERSPFEPIPCQNLWIKLGPRNCESHLPKLWIDDEVASGCATAGSPAIHGWRSEFEFTWDPKCTAEVFRLPRSPTAPKLMNLGRHSHFGDVIWLFWHFCLSLILFDVLTLATTTNALTHAKNLLVIYWWPLCIYRGSFSIIWHNLVSFGDQLLTDSWQKHYSSDTVSHVSDTCIFDLTPDLLIRGTN